MYVEDSLLAKAPSEGLSSICYLENYIFLVSDTEFLKYSLPGKTFEETLSQQDTEFRHYQVCSKGKTYTFQKLKLKRYSYMIIY